MAGEVGARLGEIDLVAHWDLPGGRILHDAIERAFAADREVAHAQQAFLRALVERRRIHADPHLAAQHARIEVGEAEQRAGIVGLEIDHRTAGGDARAHLAEQRRVAADLGAEAEAAHAATAAGQPQIETA